MYTRSYGEEKSMIIPESYGGTAFREEPPASEDTASQEESARVSAPPHNNPWDITDSQKEDAGDAAEAGIFSKLPLGGIFGGIGKVFGKDGFHFPKIGTEEILIIAAAVFLLFTSDRDFECSLMLLFLLFIT